MERTQRWPLPVALSLSILFAVSKSQDFNSNDCETPNKQVGRCIPIKSCVPMLNFIMNIENTPSIRRYLLQYVCRGAGIDISVCCPFTEIKLMERLTQQPKSLWPEDNSQHGNVNLLPKSCGQQFVDKITYGRRTRLYEYPWAAALKMVTGNFDCGGSLINDRYVLTAAHCVKGGMFDVIGVRIGEHDFNATIDCQTDGGGTFCAKPHQDFDISKDDITVHPNFTIQGLKNDIALIRLRKPVIENSGVAPICLPITREEKLNVIEVYTVIGWGLTHFNDRSKMLLQADVPFQDVAKCPGVTSFRSQLCAGGVNETDACFGDSGGPLMARFVKGYEDRMIQYGIVSYGCQICGRENCPTTYTNVADYIHWILDNMLA